MLRYMTAGESHGRGLVAIVDGVPAGLALDKTFINSELARRMVGYGRGDRMKIEKDEADILAGCRAGTTIGAPIALIINNKDYKIDELPDVKCPRPGHADLAGMQKYNVKDARSVLERASARDTAARTAAGAVAKLLLKRFGIKFTSHVTMIGGIEADASALDFDKLTELAEKSDLRCADKSAEDKMRRLIEAAEKEGDTLGGAFEVIVRGVPPGLGSYTQWDRRLDGALARACAAIPAVKAVSIGSGIESAGLKGSAVHDEIIYEPDKKSFKRRTNRAGGLEGGVTNGSDIVIRAFMKPIATLKNALKSVNVDTREEELAAVERADVTAVAPCAVVAEAVTAFEIASAFLEKFGGDSMTELERNYKGYIRQLKEI